ncbi:FkbM family methyltransferase [Ectopseudomonas mendocina]|uniref:FkbM family methyltransferase n=1 Tax=Ectopseudomonas mendocina TaxID=300 RepID=A0ABD7RWU6_ECTME|nr:FkbM family methyltransferase [Pseudomonas mendocina]TRO07473.1 FkbM family methyltransferase [Pseudomonas mendocina]TRO16535.1 FkbM family methyltransferase [Pseudomonas mendocina]
MNETPLLEMKAYIERQLKPHQPLAGLESIWVYKKKCVTLEFKRGPVGFCFDIIPSHDNKISIDLIQRDPIRGQYITESGLQIVRLAQQVSLEDGLPLIINKARDFIHSIGNTLENLDGAHQYGARYLQPDVFSPLLGLSIDEYLARIASQKNELERNIVTSDKKNRGRKKITEHLEALFVELNSHCKPSLILEVGAHEATFSLKMKKLLNNSRVMAMEANPEVFEKHREKADQSGVEYLNLAISDRNGEILLKVPMNADGQETRSMGSIHTYVDGQGFQEHTIRSCTLDSLFDVPTKNAIWIDVEGACLEVINGASRTLNESIIVYAELEEEARWAGQATLEEVAHKLYEFDLIPLFTDIQRMHWQSNILFVKKSLLDEHGVLDLLSSFPQRINDLIHSLG